MNYVVIEIQTYDNGTTACLTDSFTEKNLAEQKYHTALAAAAVSGLPCHSVIMVTNTGSFMKCETYENVPDPEPEEEPTPEETLPDYEY